MRLSAHASDRKLRTSLAVTAGVVGALAAVGFAVDPGAPAPREDEVVSPAAESAVAAAPEAVAGVASLPPAPAPGPAPRVPAPDEPTGPLGVPAIAMRAYQQAADRLGAEQPGCALPWTLLAGIGQVESQHGAGKFFTNGDTLDRITGPRLDGHVPGTAVIKDTDGGRFDGDPEFDRAVGPVQFIPETWEKLKRDANDDGVADPNNVFDSALSTGTMLCNSGGSMEDPSARERAVLSYNNSHAYVQNVVAWARGYATGVQPSPEELPEIHPAPKVPEKCPDGWEGTPTAAPEPSAEGEPAKPVPGCTQVPPPPAPVPAPAPHAPEPAPAPAPAPEYAAAPQDAAATAPSGTAPQHPAPAPAPVPALPCIPPFCAPPA